MADLRKIYIFRDLKELSKNFQNKGNYGFRCGTDYTNENCMADYQTGTPPTMTKRENYTHCNPKNNCGPNEFLMKNSEGYEFVTDEFNQPSFQIGDYTHNWEELCKSVNEVVTKIKKDKNEEWDNNQKEWTKISDYLDAVDTPETTQVEQLTSKPKVFISCHQHTL